MNDLAEDCATQAGVSELPIARQSQAHNAREVTRFLCSQAYLSGAAFRASVLDFYAANADAVAPELGIDARLVVQVCLEAQRRQRTHDMVLFCLALAGLAVWWMDLLGWLLLLVPAAAVVHVVRERANHKQAARFSKARFDVDACARQYADVPIPPEIDAALPRPDQNLVMYCETMPFVGAGTLDGGWSFNCSLDHAASGKTISAFTVADVYAHIEAALGRLRVPGLEYGHQLFVRGSEVRDQPALFTQAGMRPVQRVPDEWMSTCMSACDERMRHYLCIRIVDWGGEVVTSFYLRFVMQGNGLYVDSNRFFLGPVKNEFRTVDRLSVPTLADQARLLGNALLLGPFAAALSLFLPLVAVSRALQGSNRRNIRRQRLATEPNYNFGAATSLRMTVATTSFQNYFQISDVDFNRKLIERNLLDEIGNFLQAHGIDDLDVRDRRTTILNNGVFVQGGNVHAGALAVGAAATASSGTGSSRA